MLTKLIFGLYLAALIALVTVADRGELSRYLTIQDRIPFGDKIGHFFLMGGLSFLLNYALAVRKVTFFGLKCHLGSLIVLFLVLAEESSQYFLPHRSFSLSDILSDIAGIFFFAWIAQIVYLKRNPQHNSN